MKKKNWVRFKYERLPNICYWCGRLDHPKNECKLWLDSKGTLSPDQRQFDQSLRASPYRSHNKLVVFVPGFYNGAGPSVKRNSEHGEGSHQDTAKKSESNLPFEVNPIMETKHGEILVNMARLIPLRQICMSIRKVQNVENHQCPSQLCCLR